MRGTSESYAEISFNAGFGSNGLNGAEVFGAFMGNQMEAVIYGLIFVLLTMIIVMGAVVGLVVMSVMLPIFDFATAAH